MPKAIVIEIQVGGERVCDNLQEACKVYTKGIESQMLSRTKIHFTIKLPTGEEKTITIRDEDNQTVAYGNFEGLPNFLDYAKEVIDE